MCLAPKIDELRQFANDHEPAIMCFTETWLKDTVDNNVIFINQYSIVWKDRTRAQHGGVYMHVRASTPVTIVTEYDVEDVEILWCKLRPSRLPLGFSHLIVATVYHPPTADDNVLINHITDTLSKIESTMPHAAIIIAGDFNRLSINQITNQFRLKQLVKFLTRGERTLDLILTKILPKP
jgi:exonuclease III